MIEEVLAYNREFVRSKGYEKFQTSKYPDKKIAILTCMDTRLVELLGGFEPPTSSLPMGRRLY